jgi:hypothetical protein
VAWPRHGERGTRSTWPELLDDSRCADRMQRGLGGCSW